MTRKHEASTQRNRDGSGPAGAPASKQSAHDQTTEPTMYVTESTCDAHDGGFRVLGIGASAGGLAAPKEFFGAMPADSGMASVIVQHIEPTHESRMAEILAKCTPMKVAAAEDGMAVEPNSVYTNPPCRSLSIRDGRLRLQT